MGDTVRKIYTFEAMPENIKILEKKKAEIEKVWTGTLKIVPYALADKKGTVTFFETEKKAGVSLLNSGMRPSIYGKNLSGN